MPNYIALSDASIKLRDARRVLVIGCSGGGKSTLSKTLGEHLGLKFISSDRDVRWLPGWQVRDREEQREILKNLVQQERWIIDGTSPSSFDIRLPRTDIVLWVRVPRYICFLGVARRVRKYYGTTRPEMAQGCQEPLPDREFLSYIWNFEKRTAPSVVKHLDLHGPNVPVLVLNSHTQMSQLTNSVGVSASRPNKP